MIIYTVSCTCLDWSHIPIQPKKDGDFHFYLLKMETDSKLYPPAWLPDVAQECGSSEGKVDYDKDAHY